MGMQLIETVTVGSGGASSIEFTSIPQDGVDLVIVVSGRSSRSSVIDWIGLQFNNLTTSIYNFVHLEGFSDSVSTQLSTAQTQIDYAFVSAATSTTNSFGSAQWYVSNYTSSVAKSVSIEAVAENNSSSYALNIAAGLFNSTEAITIVELTPTNGNFVEHSTASLYKITAD
jgi:hypothetical protein